MLGIIFGFQAKTITWQDISIPMQPPNCTVAEFFFINESLPMRNRTKRINKVLDAEYKKINLTGIVNNLAYSKDKHQAFLLHLLQKYKQMCDEISGKYTSSDYIIEMKEARCKALPYYKPFHIPKINKPTIKTEIENLLKIVLLKRINGFTR